MANVETIEIYNALKDRLGEEQTRLLLKYIEEASRANVATKEDLLSTEENLREETTAIREDIAKQETELRREMAQIEIRLREEVHKLRDELKSETFKIKTILYVLIVLLLISPTPNWWNCWVESWA